MLEFMRICPNCKTQIDTDKKSCQACGTLLFYEIIWKQLPAYSIKIIRKVAKLFAFCLCFALWPLALLAPGWLLGVLLQCGSGISRHSCEYLPDLADTIMLISLLDANVLFITIPAGIMLFFIGIITLGLSRGSLIRWIQAILLLPTTLGLIIYIILQCSTFITHRF
jgi:hypothetical protein